MKPLEPELFGYIHYKLNGWLVNVILIYEGFWYYTHEPGILEDSPEKG